MIDKCYSRHYNKAIKRRDVRYMLTESQRRAQRKYTSRMRDITVRLNPEREQDIIDWLDAQPQKRAYIVQLIREDMKRNVQGNVQ